MFVRFGGSILRSGGMVMNIKIRVISDLPSEHLVKFTDVMLQEGDEINGYAESVYEQTTDKADVQYFNSVCRGNKTMIVPYMSYLPYPNCDELCLDNGDISTPLNLKIKKVVGQHEEDVKLYKGIKNGRRLTIEDFGLDMQYKLDSSVSREYKDGVEVFNGNSIIIANADNRITIEQQQETKSNLLFWINNTKRGRQLQDLREATHEQLSDYTHRFLSGFNHNEL